MFLDNFVLTNIKSAVIVNLSLNIKYLTIHTLQVFCDKKGKLTYKRGK